MSLKYLRQINLANSFNLPERITAATTRGTYDGRELTRTCDRPNAYDAYDKPSVMGTQKIYPRGAVTPDMM